MIKNITEKKTHGKIFLRKSPYSLIHNTDVFKGSYSLRVSCSDKFFESAGLKEGAQRSIEKGGRGQLTREWPMIGLFVLKSIIFFNI